MKLFICYKELKGFQLEKEQPTISRWKDRHHMLSKREHSR